jgi:hypothetical protein
MMGAILDAIVIGWFVAGASVWLGDEITAIRRALRE